MTSDERLDRLTGIVDALASSVVAHDNQIDALIKVAERHEAQLATVVEEMRNLQRQWQAYINTLPKQ